MKSNIVWIVIAIVAISSISILTLKTDTNRLAHPVLEGSKAIVYKSPTCGCCEGHAIAMRKAGIEVEIVEDADLVTLKDTHNIPLDMQACHTTLLTHGTSKYVVEGHVPIEGITTLLEQKPDIEGIALPGMPIGTPGMPGPKTSPYNIMTLDNGETPKLFMSI